MPPKPPGPPSPDGPPSNKNNKAPGLPAYYKLEQGDQAAILAGSMESLYGVLLLTRTNTSADEIRTLILNSPLITFSEFLKKHEENFRNGNKYPDGFFDEYAKQISLYDETIKYIQSSKWQTVAKLQEKVSGVIEKLNKDYGLR